MIDIQYYEWASLFFRWFHVIAAIAWIGASFYFVWLDNSLQTPPDWKAERGIKGDLWAFHGGGIYEVAKYKLAPEKMPSTLHWFKWEAYTTWLTGTILLCIIYYFKADLYLISSDKWISHSGVGIVASILFILSGVAVYELLFRAFSLRKNQFIIAGIVLYIAAACYFSVKLFSDRAAFLHVGAMIASIMAANVKLGIIPAQQGFIKQLNKGETPQEAPMERAKLRSFHNNYFTLPVIFCMISNHYSFIYGHDYNWLLFISILALTAYTRHYFNLKHRGIHKPLILLTSVLLLAGLALISAIEINKESVDSNTTTKQELDAQSSSNSDNRLLSLAQKHCAGCHSDEPSMAGFLEAPAGLIFESVEDLTKSKSVIITAVESNYMPLGNMTGMTEAERKEFIVALEN